jgi:hypothetical protein
MSAPLTTGSKVPLFSQNPESRILAKGGNSKARDNLCGEEWPANRQTSETALMAAVPLAVRRCHYVSLRNYAKKN